MFKLLSIIVLAMAAIFGTMFHQLDKRLTKFEGASGRALSSTDDTEPKNKRLKMRMGLVEDYLDTTTQVRMLRELRKRIGGDASAKLNSWLSGEPCDGEGDDWFGIECNENEEVKQLDFIALDITLDGKLPDSIGKLRSLESLRFIENELKGAIPESIGDLVQLTHLDLEDNEFKGNIPETIGNLVDLEFLDLQINKLSGPIPESIGNLEKLTQLYLNQNDLTGVSASIGNLVKLNVLDLSGNKFQGNIPETIGNLADLENLYLSYNKLTGPIPASIGNLVKLTQLYLNQNDLTGPIPASIGNLVNLKWLTLNGNDELTGSIPESLCSLEIDIRHGKGVTCPSQCPCTLVE